MPEKYSTISVLFKPEIPEKPHPKIYNEIEGRYKISGDYVPWAPGRPVYRHMFKKDYYIFWTLNDVMDDWRHNGWTIYKSNGESKYRILEWRET